jgi:hypothetical protein
MVSAVAVVWGAVLVVAPPARAAEATAIDANSMSLTAGKGTTVYSDPTASGGIAIALTGAVTIASTLTIPDSIRVVVRAKARPCFGAPIGRVSVDGVDIGTSPVTASTWTDYTATAAISAGSHTIGVSFTNPLWFGCSRVLYVDTISVVAATVSTSPDILTTAPVGNLPGWTHIFADDFTRDAALGTWANPSDPTKVVYVGSGGQRWLTYPQTFTDTYQHRPYRSDQVLSVSNGALDFFLHNVDGKPAGANPSPVLPDGTPYQTYGRYSARLKVDTPTLSEYHIAFLLWPKSEQWPNDGEIDFPEGALSSTSHAYAHYARSTGGQDGVDTGVTFTDWHVYTFEWLPGHVRFYLDGDLVLDSTRYVPSKPMRWQLQTETDGNGTNAGHLLVDWVSVWSYAGG